MKKLKYLILGSFLTFAILISHLNLAHAIWSGRGKVYFIMNDAEKIVFRMDGADHPAECPRGTDMVIAPWYDGSPHRNYSESRKKDVMNRMLGQLLTSRAMRWTVQTRISHVDELGCHVSQIKSE